MQEMVMPADGVEYLVSLGSTLSSDQGSHAEQFITLRYDFKPASLAREGEGVLEVHPDSHTAVVRLPSSAAGVAPLAFAGKHEPSRDGLDCVAIFDGQGFRLEVLGASVKNLKHAPGASRGGPASRAPKAAAQQPAAAPDLDFADSLMLEEEMFRAMAEEAAPAATEAAAMATDAPPAARAAAAAAPAALSAGAGSPPALAAAPAVAAAPAAPAAARPAPPPPALLPKRKAPRLEEMNDLDREFFGAGFGGEDSPDVAQDSGSSGSEEEEEGESEGEEAAKGACGGQEPTGSDEFI